MAVPAGKKIGNTSIQVIPDATKFRDDLKVLLKRVENTMFANIEVRADTARFDVDMKRALKKWNGQDVSFNVDAKTAGASAHVKEFTRPRKLPISVDVTKQSLAKAGTLIASLSGARLLGDIGKNVSNSVQNLDRALPKLALVSQGIGSGSAVVINALRGAGAVLVQLTQLLPLAALLPGVLLGAGLGVTALVLALKDAPARLGATATAYKGLSKVVSNNFWAQAAKPIKSLLSTSLPALRSGFAELSSELGNDFANVAGILQSSLGGGQLQKLFNDVTNGAAAALPGVNAFVGSFVPLLRIGTSYLPIFGRWISSIGNDFSKWVSGAISTGQLNRGISTAIDLLKNLFGIAHSVGGILTGIFNAGSGGNPIGGLASGLAAVAQTVNTPGFQTALKTIFTGAAAGAGALADALAPIGKAIGSLAPTIGAILGGAGGAVAGLLKNVAKALSTPAFQNGLNSFFAGIETGLHAIGPALPSLASALGALGTFAGKLAAQLGPVLGTAITQLAPIFTSLLQAIAPILPILGQALISAIKEIAPLLPGIIQALVPLLPTLANFVQTLLPQLVFDVVALTQSLTPVLYLINGLISVLNFLITPFEQLNKEFVALADGVSPTTLVLDALKGKFGPLAQGLATFGVAIGTFIGAGARDFVGFINMMIKAVDVLIDGWNTFAGALKKLSGGSINLHLGQIATLPLPGGKASSGSDARLVKGATGLGIAPSASGTLALLGEAGRAEDVVDHGNMNQLINAVNRRLNSSPVAGATVHVTQQFAPVPEQDARITARNAGREFASALAGSI